MRTQTITAIPSYYSGVTFRSKSEATFARWCDSWNIVWDYEPEGLQFGNVSYVPDFWLPEGKTIVEIKPVIFASELWKMDALAKALTIPETEPVADGLCQQPRLQDNLVLWCGQMHRDGFQLIKQFKDSGWEGPGEPTTAVSCTRCGKPHFIGFGIWDCRWCGAYAGDHFLCPFPDYALPCFVPMGMPTRSVNHVPG